MERKAQISASSRRRRQCVESYLQCEEFTVCLRPKAHNQHTEGLIAAPTCWGCPTAPCTRKPVYPFQGSVSGLCVSRITLQPRLLRFQIWKNSNPLITWMRWSLHGDICDSLICWRYPFLHCVCSAKYEARGYWSEQNCDNKKLFFSM